MRRVNAEGGSADGATGPKARPGRLAAGRRRQWPWPGAAFGKVPTEVSLEAAHQAAGRTALSVLGSLKRALGDLDRVTAWLMVYGMVNADAGYSQTTNAINGFSDLIVDLYGPEVGAHARVAVGMAALPLDNAVTVAAEVAVAD